jgi:hypothetical protein
MHADYITEIRDLLRLKPKHGSESYRNRINFLRRSRQLAQAEMLASRSYLLILVHS